MIALLKRPGASLPILSRLVVCAVCLLSVPASAQTEGEQETQRGAEPEAGLRRAVELEVGGSLIMPAADRSPESLAGHYQLRVGASWGRIGIWGAAEHAFWSAGPEPIQALNIGVGLEIRSRVPSVRARLFAGPSILLRGTELDQPGQVGLFFEIRPFEYHRAFAETWFFQVTPMHLVVLMPVVTGIPLVDIQLRTSISVGAGW